MNLADQIRIVISLLINGTADKHNENAKIVGITNAILIVLQKNGYITERELEELTISTKEFLVLGKFKYDSKEPSLPQSEDMPKKTKLKKVRYKKVSQPDNNKNREEGE